MRITALNVYPIKSCRGIALEQAKLTTTGLAHDREWLVVDAANRFLTQRVEPRMALIVPTLIADGVALNAPGMQSLSVTPGDACTPVTVTVWKDQCIALDAGDVAAEWLSTYLERPCRLVRFNPNHTRLVDRTWTGELEAHSQFSDGFPLLIISEASLADLNERLPAGVGPLPMNRFRPNIVVSGIPAYGEDTLGDLRSREITLRVVKPCTRCAITTTDQHTGKPLGDEPLRTLRAYRFDRQLKGVIFGQNVIIVGGVDAPLAVGQSFETTPRAVVRNLPQTIA